VLKLKEDTMRRAVTSGKLLLVLLGLFLSVSAMAAPVSAAAPATAAGLFFDELLPLGNWVDYQTYGPVWYPTGVNQDWRPYVNGRWSPSPRGWVFETREKWGWATYHFGNWLLTQEMGWVWVPGNTWYPSTASWRQSKEFVGWAPIPPPQAKSEPVVTAARDDVSVNPAIWIYSPNSDFVDQLDKSFDSTMAYTDRSSLVSPELAPQLFAATAPSANIVAPVEVQEAAYDFGPNVEEISSYSESSTIIRERYYSCNYAVMPGIMPPMLLVNRYPAIFQTVNMAGGAAANPPIVAVRRTSTFSLARPAVTPLPAQTPVIQAVIQKAPTNPAVTLGQKPKGLGLPGKAIVPTAQLKDITPVKGAAAATVKGPSPKTVKSQETAAPKGTAAASTARQAEKPQTVKPAPAASKSAGSEPKGKTASVQETPDQRKSRLKSVVQTPAAVRPQPTQASLTESKPGQTLQDQRRQQMRQMMQQQQQQEQQRRVQVQEVKQKAQQQQQVQRQAQRQAPVGGGGSGAVKLSGKAPPQIVRQAASGGGQHHAGQGHSGGKHSSGSKSSGKSSSGGGGKKK
jgi:hypothetical protein